MPVVNIDQQRFPGWCELHRFDIFHIEEGETTKVQWTSPQCKIVNVVGNITINDSGFTRNAAWDAPRDLAPQNRHAVIQAGTHGALFVLLEGTWSAQTGGSGVFGVSATTRPENRGDPAPNPRNTSFDNHFHDCDEYWIIIEGAGTACTEGNCYDVAAGDCIITGAGDHHDFPQVFSFPVRAVFFETSLVGQQRTGHLWEHTHGLAIPQRNPGTNS